MMTTTPKLLNATLLTGLIAYGACSLATAQSTPEADSATNPAAAAAAPNEAPAADASLQIEEIVVTAEKRAENVQDVPVAVTVVTGDALAKAGLSEFADLTKLSPSLTITSGDQPGNSAIIMRGIGTNAFSIGVEPSVLVVTDDVAQSLQAQSFSDLVDLDHVEVLRGPQSTLFGKAASAGVISVTTKAPSSAFTAFGELRATNDHEQRYAGSISGPVSDTLLYRLTASDHLYTGNVTNLPTGQLINGTHEANVRGQLQWKPSEPLKITLFGHWDRNISDCCASPYLVLTANGKYAFAPPGSNSPTAVFPGISAAPTNLNVSLSSPPQANSTDEGGSLHVSYDLGSKVLTSITATDHYNLADRTDFDGSTLANLYQYGTFNSTSFSQELRLSNTSIKPIGYVLGAYYSDDDNVRRFHRDPPVATADWRGEQTTKTAALFGQSTWYFLEKTGLITGLRVNRETIGYDFNNYRVPLPAGASASYPLPGAPGTSTESVVLGKFGVQQELAPDVMAFLTYSKGYKGQAYDLTSSFNNLVALNQPVKSEHSNNYELGIKTLLLDRRVMLDATLFHTDYANLQAQTIEPGLGGSFVLANVGTVRTQGLEVEGSARVSQALQLSGGLAYVDAIITSFPNASCYTGQTATSGCVPTQNGVNASGQPVFVNAQNLSGFPLNNAPKWKGNVAAEYIVPLGSLPVDGAINLSYSWQSSVNLALNQDPGAAQSAYGIANLSFAIKEAKNNRYSVTVFANNLFDTHYDAAISNNGGLWGAPAAQAYQFLPPRDFKRFFGLRCTFSL